jgi:predicted RNA-binding protein with PUA domain
MEGFRNRQEILLGHFLDTYDIPEGIVSLANDNPGKLDSADEWDNVDAHRYRESARFSFRIRSTSRIA